MDVVGDFLSLIDAEKAPLFRRLADCAITLGYRAKRDRTQHVAVSFSARRLGNTILRFVHDKQTSFRLRFWAAESYSPAFAERLRYTIERFDFRYTGCYGCGRCPGRPLGYDIPYDDGRRYFRCGNELIEFTEIDADICVEAERLMRLQADYYLRRSDSQTR